MMANLSTKVRFASLSLDLDNKWSYMKTHGDPGWDAFPTYLGTVVPRVLEMCRRHAISITVFVVGQDAAREENHRALRALADAGHEIGNHSFHHEPWLHLYAEDQLERELARAEEAIVAATGNKPIGFRGPGFSLSETTLRVLARRGYQYDCSTFPTFLGPLARAYYFMTASLTKEQKQERKRLFGKMSEGFRPLRPYAWRIPTGDAFPAAGELLEIPVTTFPVIKIPIHVSYLLYLRQFSRPAAWQYFQAAMRACQWLRIEPSLLLHPLDFLGCDDDRDLSFFPAMRSTSHFKLEFVDRILGAYTRRFQVGTMADHASRVAARRQEAVGQTRDTSEVAC